MIGESSQIIVGNDPASGSLVLSDPNVEILVASGIPKILKMSDDEFRAKVPPRPAPDAILVVPPRTFEEFRQLARSMGGLIISTGAQCHWKTSHESPYWISAITISEYKHSPSETITGLKGAKFDALNCAEGIALAWAIKAQRISTAGCRSIDLLSCGGGHGGHVVVLRPSGKNGWEKMELATRTSHWVKGASFATRAILK